jgi:hypothetical protein
MLAAAVPQIPCPASILTFFLLSGFRCHTHAACSPPHHVRCGGVAGAALQRSAASLAAAFGLEWYIGHFGRTAAWSRRACWATQLSVSQSPVIKIAYTMFVAVGCALAGRWCCCITPSAATLRLTPGWCCRQVRQGCRRLHWLQQAGRTRSVRPYLGVVSRRRKHNLIAGLVAGLLHACTQAKHDTGCATAHHSTAQRSAPGRAGGGALCAMRLVVFQLPTSRSLVSRVGLQVSRLDCRQGSSGSEGW